LASGLAKKLRAAILKQTDLRAKVRVRGEDGEMDDDGEPAEHEGTESQGESATTGTPIDPHKADFERRWAALEPEVKTMLAAGNGDLAKLRAVADFVDGKAQAGAYAAALQGLDSLVKLMEGIRAIPAAPPLQPRPEANKPQGAEPGAEAADFNKRLAALLPRVKEAVAVDADKGQTIKLKLSEAGVFARKHEFGTANALLDEAEALLAGIGSKPGQQGTEQGVEQRETQGEEQRGQTPEPRAPRTVAPRVAFTQARLDWDKTRQFVQSELRKLEASILADSSEEEDFDAISGGTSNLYQVLDVLDERLIDKLDEALNAEGEKRRTFNGEAIALIKEYQDFVDSEPLMQDIDDSGFIDLKIRSTLTAQLKRMSDTLGATMARI
jgi:hypothetical protein